MLRFLFLVVLLTTPFWVAGALLNYSFLPGLNAAVLAVVVPSVAATLTLWRTEGLQAVRDLLRRAGDFVRLPVWGWAAAIGAPCAMAGASWAWRLVHGQPVAFTLDIFSLGPVVALILVAAVLEELGWTGFATDRLVARSGVLAGAIALGFIWALWHYPTLIQLGRGAGWIAWWTLWTVSQRVTMVVIYLRAGRNFAAPVIFHAASNIAWQAAPEAFEPAVEALSALAIAASAVLLSRTRAPE